MPLPRLRTLTAFAVVCAAASAQSNHQRSQSPVKDQGARGTCSAFAICAALETFPGVPTDLSEQLLYATVKRHEKGVDDWLRQAGAPTQMSEGNMLATYAALFARLGTCREGLLPYNPNPVALGPEVPEALRQFLSLAQVGERDLTALRDAFGKYGFRPEDCETLDAAAAADVDRLKALLDGGVLAIPVSYAMHGPNWSKLQKGALGAATIDPGMQARFKLADDPEWSNYADVKLRAGGKKIDFVAGVQSGAILFEFLPDPDPANSVYGGHSVTIVGYDPAGFRIKNSWGPAWADGGYATVLYDYHRLLVTGALAIRDARVRMPSLSPFARRDGIARAGFRLKAQRRGDGPFARLLLSTWQTDPRDADAQVVEYTVEGRDADGVWRALGTQAVAAGAVEERRGAAWSVPIADLGAAVAVRVTARYGDRPLGDASPLAETRYLATARYPEFAVDLATAIDLAPVGR